MGTPFLMHWAQIHPMNPAVAPTDKSIPPVSSTAVNPALSTSNTLACLNTVIMLSTVLKLGAAIAEKMTRMIKPIRL